MSLAAVYSMWWCGLLVVTVAGVSNGIRLAATPTTARPATHSATDEDRLLAKLPGLRDPLVRPDLEATLIKINLGVVYLTLDEMHSTVTVRATVKMEWTDARNEWLKLSNGSFAHIKELSVLVKDIWHPDVVLTNSLEGKGASLDGALATLLPDGRVVWSPTADLEAFCQLDLKRWPFENHVCQLHFGSWSLPTTELKFADVNHTLEFPGQAGEFVLDAVMETFEKRVEAEAESQAEAAAPRTFDGVVYSLFIRREPGSYRSVIFTPAAVVVILCLSTFLLPPSASEKVVLGGVNAMLICLFLIYFTHSLPVLNSETPYIVVFYSASLYMVSLSLVAAVAVLNMSRQQHAAGLPWAVKNFLTGPCGRFLMLSNYIEQMMGVDHGPCSSARSEELPVVMHDSMDGGGEASDGGPGGSQRIASKRVSPDLDWLLLAAAVDRVLLIVYALVFAIMAIAFHV